MPKSDFVHQLDVIQATVHSFLRPLGFRKRGRTHNRTTAGGLVHAIDFQMGQFPIGDHYVVPGMRDNLYGRFVVNLGVFLPCVFEVEGQCASPKFVQECLCSIRERLGVLVTGQDEWIEITGDASITANQVVAWLDRLGLPFLEEYETYDDVLSHYRVHGSLPSMNPGRATLEAALIAHRLGDEIGCRSLLDQAHHTDHKGFREHVAKLANRIGHPRE